MKIVADTSVLIDFLRSKSPQNSFFYNLISGNDVIISLITVAELFSGKSAQTKIGREKLFNLIDGLEVRIPDLKDAVAAGEIRSEYQLSLADAFIASLALKLNLPLATLNQKDFTPVSRLKLHQL